MNGGIYIKSKKTRAIFIVTIVVLVLVASLFVINSRGDSNAKENTLIDVAKNSSFFEEDKPFVFESLISGRISLKSENSQFAKLSESSAKELANVLNTSTVKESNKSLKSKGYPTYMIVLNNENYTMSYDLEIFFMMQKDEETNEVLINADFADGIYVTDDLSIYDKVIELIEKDSLSE